MLDFFRTVGVASIRTIHSACKILHVVLIFFASISAWKNDLGFIGYLQRSAFRNSHISDAARGGTFHYMPYGLSKVM